MHSLPTRLKAVIYCKDFGMSLRKAAKLCNVGKSSVHRWCCQNIENTWSRSRAKVKRRSTSRRLDVLVQKCLDRDPFATTAQLVSQARDQLDLKVSLSTIARSRRRLGYRYKLSSRSQSHQRADPTHPFFTDSNVYDGVIAIDESSFVSADRPRRGWAKPNCAVPRAPPTQRSRISLLLAIDENGIVAMDHRKGAYNTESYASFVSSLPENRTLLADNVAFHKANRVKEVATERGQTLKYTPPYCPWFNPVEYAFSVSKCAYRQARLEGRQDFVTDALAAVRHRVTSEKCRAFFSKAAHAVDMERARGAP